MDLSQLKWVKNVRRTDGQWAYQDIDEMPIPEAKIFRVHWRQDIKNAKKPLKGDFIALVQKAKMTHIVEVLDDVVYGENKQDWNIYRVVRAVWMPPKNYNWDHLPHTQDFFGVEHLPSHGMVHNLSENQIGEHWKNLGGLEGLQQHIKKVLLPIL